MGQRSRILYCVCVCLYVRRQKKYVRLAVTEDNESVDEERGRFSRFIPATLRVHGSSSLVSSDVLIVCRIELRLNMRLNRLSVFSSPWLSSDVAASRYRRRKQPNGDADRCDTASASLSFCSMQLVLGSIS